MSHLASSMLETRHPAVLRLDGPLDLLDEHFLQRVDAAPHRAACGVLVPAAVEFLRDRADVDLALRSHAHAVRLALGLLEEDDGLDLLHVERKLDEPFAVPVRDASGALPLVIERDDTDAPGDIAR